SSGTYNGTVTVTLGNVPAKFNWCAYVSDYPPNAVINGNSYTLKGTPPFVVNGSSLGAGVTSYSGGCITSITDATGCPGLFPVPTTTSLTANPTSICNGSSAILTAVASGAASYSFDNGSSWQASPTKTVTPTATTNYTLKVRSSVGCTSTDSKTASIAVTNPSSRDVAPNSCGCASGLTTVGGYCRNLSADGASTYTGCNVEVYEVAFGNSGYTRATAKTYCSNKGGGWRLANCTELACMQSAGILTICHWYAADQGTVWAVYKRPGCVTINGTCPNGSGCSNCTGDHAALAAVCVR
ncbi:MAG: hypothetical protein LBD87_01400, partial [Prevotellaceae bacterium]|nr:hypothetical protein [Prevotellaceae bacterium]